MFDKKTQQHYQNILATIQKDGFEKLEGVITSPQSAEITLKNGQKVINFCANNYLGLANDARLIESAKKGLDTYGYGCASVRFICGTQSVHKQLEEALSQFLSTDDCILYSSCFDANGGVFETLLDEHDAVISDELNHASIIDGVRLCKAKRYRYKNNDMVDLEAKLKEAKSSGAINVLVVSDGVFSMDGIVANVKGICQLANQYEAMVMIDDSHAVGFMGETGAGTPELWGVSTEVDLYSGTLGKALGGASGGYVAGKKPLIDLLRQRSRPYLFSNTLVPAIASTTLAILDILKKEGGFLRKKLFDNMTLFRTEMSKRGFVLQGEGHPIIPVMLGDAKLASNMAKMLLQEGVYVVGFSYPVVPKEKARIRTQLSAGHSAEQILFAIEKFEKIGKALNVIQ